MEEFLKKGSIMKSQIKCLERLIDHFIDQINENCKRDGMGTILIKNHLFFHLPKYISLWGAPKNWDSASSESHHKTEIKAPSKNTQNNASTFIQQTATRQTEKKILDCFGTLPTTTSLSSTPKAVSGSKFIIYRNDSGDPAMSWSKLENKDKPHHPQIILKFCCDELLTSTSSLTEIRGFTEHNRICQESNHVHRFRCHPSYRSDAGLVADSWYDWALFSFIGQDNTGMEDIPCQILCFLDLNNCTNHSKYSPGEYAVIRSFKSLPKKISGKKISIIEEGTLYDNLLLTPYECIADSVAVVQNITSPSTDNQFFVVKNRTEWLTLFYKKLVSFDP